MRLGPPRGQEARSRVPGQRRAGPKDAGLDPRRRIPNFEPRQPAQMSAMRVETGRADLRLFQSSRTGRSLACRAPARHAPVTKSGRRFRIRARCAAANHAVRRARQAPASYAAPTWTPLERSSAVYAAQTAGSGRSVSSGFGIRLGAAHRRSCKLSRRHDPGWICKIHNRQADPVVASRAANPGRTAAGRQVWATCNSFISCTASVPTCNNLFYIERGVVTRYTPIGTGGGRCFTDEATTAAPRKLLCQ
jgi:hypothetical protein